LETPSKKTGKIVLTTTPTSKRNYNCNSLALLSLPLSTSTSTSTSTSSHHMHIHSSRASARVVQEVQESSEKRKAAAPTRRCFKGEEPPVLEAAKRRLSATVAVDATTSTSRLRERSSERRRNSASAISRDDKSLLDRSSRSKRRDQYQDQSISLEDENNCFASPSTTTPLDALHLREQVKKKTRPHSIAMTPITTEDSSKSIVRVLEKTLTKEERRKARRAKKGADEEELVCASTSIGFEVNNNYKKPRRIEAKYSASNTCMVKAVPVQDCKQQEEQSKASKKQQKQEPQESSQSPVIPKTPTLAAWQLREQIKKSPAPIQARRKRLVSKKEESPKEEPFKQDESPLKAQRKNTKEKEREERRKSRSSRTYIARKELESKSQDELLSGFAVSSKKTSKTDKPKDDQQKTPRETRRKSRISTRVSVAKTELQSKPAHDELPSGGLACSLKPTSKTKKEDTPKDEDKSKAKRRKSRTIRTSATKKELETNPKDKNLPLGFAGLRDATNRRTFEKVRADMTPATPRSSKWVKVRASNGFIISTKKQAETTRRSRHDEPPPQSPKYENEEGTGSTRSRPFASVPQSPGTRRSHPMVAWQLREQAKKKGPPGGLNRSSAHHHSAHRRSVALESPATLPPAFCSILTTPRSAIQQRPNKYVTTKSAMEQQKSESAVRRISILDSMSNFLEPHETDPQKMISTGKVEIINGKTRIVFELGDAASLQVSEGTRIPLAPSLFR
jgi:hypothetical protein